MRLVVWGWFRCVLILVLVYLKLVLPPSQLLKLIIFLKDKNCIAVNAEIGSENCVADDQEISSENYFAADVEIGSKN